MWKVLNKVDLGEPTSFLDHVYLECTQRQCQNKQRYCWQLQNHVWIQNFRRSKLKNYQARKIYVFLRGHMTWKVMPRNVWNDIVSWRTKRLNYCIKYQLLAFTAIITKKNWNPSENCQKYALKLFWKAETWHVLDDPIFYSQWTNLHDRSQNGPKHVDKRLSRLISYIHDTCELQTILSCGKHCKTMQIGTVSRLRFCSRSWGFKIQMEHCAFSEVIRFVPISWMCKKQTSVSQFNRIRKSFPWMQVRKGRYTRAWLVGSDRYCSLRKHVPEWSSTGRSVYEPTWGSCSTSHTSKNEKKSHGMIDNLDNVDFFPQTWILLVRKLCCMCLKTTNSSDQDDHKGKKSDNEICFQHPQSCSWSVVW